MPTIKEVKERLAMIDELDHPFFEELILDGRAGVQAAISKRKRELKTSGRRFAFGKMLAYEKELYTQGIQLIAGVDEVGRGPLAGTSCCSCRDLAGKLVKFQDSTIVKNSKIKHKEIYQGCLQNSHCDRNRHQG